MKKCTTCGCDVNPELGAQKCDLCWEVESRLKSYLASKGGREMALKAIFGEHPKVLVGTATADGTDGDSSTTVEWFFNSEEEGKQWMKNAEAEQEANFEEGSSRYQFDLGWVNRYERE